MGRYYAASDRPVSGRLQRPSRLPNRVPFTSSPAHRELSHCLHTVFRRRPSLRSELNGDDVRPVQTHLAALRRFTLVTIPLPKIYNISPLQLAHPQQLLLNNVSFPLTGKSHGAFQDTRKLGIACGCGTWTATSLWLTQRSRGTAGRRTGWSGGRRTCRRRRRCYRATSTRCSIGKRRNIGRESTVSFPWSLEEASWMELLESELANGEKQRFQNGQGYHRG